MQPDALILTPEYRDYVWGGTRLRPGQRTAEAWVVHENNRIAAGPLAGRTLAEAALEHGADLLGRRVVDRTGTRFPLLIKLLDCGAVLSLQVHPDNAQAGQLEGPGKFGKAEAWHFLAAEQGAHIFCGVKDGVSQAELEQKVVGGGFDEIVERVQVQSGESIYIRPGLVHALGPGLLLYEVQQTSDLTYRVYDWGRPASEGRKLHTQQSLAVIDRQARPDRRAPGTLGRLFHTEYFSLDRLTAGAEAAALDTAGESFHVVTVTSGAARLAGDGWSLRLEALESALVPACAGAYRLAWDGEDCEGAGGQSAEKLEGCQALVASIAA